MPVYWPGGVRREGGASLICGYYMKRGKACADTAPVFAGKGGGGGERECTGQQKLRGVEYRCGHAGGPACSSDEASVMGVERRGWLIRGLFMRTTGHGSGGPEWANQIQR